MLPSQATITEISDVTDVDLRRGGDEAVLEMLRSNPKVASTLVRLRLVPFGGTMYS